MLYNNYSLLSIYIYIKNRNFWNFHIFPRHHNIFFLDSFYFIYLSLIFFFLRITRLFYLSLDSPPNAEELPLFKSLTFPQILNLTHAISSIKKKNPNANAKRDLRGRWLLWTFATVRWWEERAGAEAVSLEAEEEPKRKWKRWMFWTTVTVPR